MTRELGISALALEIQHEPCIYPPRGLGGCTPNDNSPTRAWLPGTSWLRTCVSGPKCCRPVDVDDVKIEGMRNAVLSLQCILYKQDYNIGNMQMICMPKYEVSWPVVLVVLVVLVVSIWKGKSRLFLRTMAPYLVINSPWLWCFSSNNALALQGHDVHGTVPTETTWHCQPTFVGDHAAEGWGPLHKSCVWNHYTSLIFLNYYWTS